MRVGTKASSRLVSSSRLICLGGVALITQSSFECLGRAESNFSLMSS